VSIPYGENYPDAGPWAEPDGTVHGGETNTPESTVLETSSPSTSKNNSSNGSNGHAELLAGVRNGTWLDQQSFPRSPMRSTASFPRGSPS
jgi:hypothetical protein